MVKYFLSIMFLISSVTAMGQYIEFGPFGGGSYYIGDLNPDKHFQMMYPAYGGIVRCNFTSRWVGRINFLFGKVSGDDQKTQTVKNRNLNFESQILEISIQGEVNFLPYYTGSWRNFFTPYLFGGVGIFTMNPIGTINGERVTLREAGTEGQLSGTNPDKKPYSLSQICFPFGMGFRVSFWNNFCLGIEWGLRKTITDYLDDCSTTYYFNSDEADFSNISKLASDPTKNHQQGMQRGSSEYKDWYSFVGLTLTYKINLFKKSTCNNFSELYDDFN
jgi:hypothetical protein